MSATSVLDGVCPVIATPFHDDGEIDVPSFDRQLDAVAATGVRTVMYPGFASEFHKLADDERQMMVDRLLTRRLDANLNIAVSVPDHATLVAVRRASEAAENGAAAVNILPPHFLGPSRAAVLDHLRAILVAVHPLPVVVQYAPVQTGATMDADTLVALAVEHPNLTHVKVESQPPGRLIAALAAGRPPLASLVGYAGVQLPDALARGAAGVQPGGSFPDLYLDIWERWHSGDRAGAEEQHRRLLPYLAYWMQHVELIVAAEKMIAVTRGWITSAHCRAPGWRLDGVELAQIARFCEEMEF